MTGPTTRITPQPAAAPARGAALTPTRDCDVCVVGDDAAGLLVACDLAARGQDVVLFPTPGEAPTLGLDASLAPGFALPARDLVAQVGAVDAAELLALSVEAAQRGLLLAQEAGLAIGPKGRLKVARAHAAGQLAAEHEALQGLAPDSSVLLGAADVAGLLGTPAFTAALGLAPAHRLDAAAFRGVLAAAAAEGELAIMPPTQALSADVHGLRKYVTAPGVRVRAFHVVFSGGAALSRVAPELVPSLVPTPWVCGRFHVAGAAVPFAGLAEEVGGTGLRWHWDGERLALAAETATRVAGRAAAARILRRHGAAVAPGIEDAPGEGTRGLLLAQTRRLMPLIQEGPKGVWYCVTPGGDALTHAIMGADLVVRAIADHDDRIRLLGPFGLEPADTRPVPPLGRMADYWRRHVADGLPGPAGATAPVSPAQRAGAPAGVAATVAAFWRRLARSAARLSRSAAERTSRE